MVAHTFEILYKIRPQGIFFFWNAFWYFFLIPKVYLKQKKLKPNFLLCWLFLKLYSKYFSEINESLFGKRYWWVEHFKPKKILMWKRKGQKLKKKKILNFLCTLFGNKVFLSQEIPIFADFEYITYYWTYYYISKTYHRNKFYALLFHTKY